MKRCLRPLLALVLSFVCLATARAGDDRIHVVVLHTNDLHGQVLPRKATRIKRDPAPMIGGLPRVAAYVNRVKAEAEKNGEIVFVVDAGDWFQGTPEGMVDDGAGFVRALALVGYDALCIGNHDFDHGIPNLVTMLKTTSLPAVAANLDDKKTQKPVEWVPQFRIVERGGLRVAFVGLVTPATPEITHPDAKTLDFIATSVALDRVMKDLKGKVDCIVPLTHEGVDDDKKLAAAHPELDLIVGGHTHTFLRTLEEGSKKVKEDGIRAGNTLIVQTGSKAEAIGRVDLWLDKATKKVLESKEKLIDLDEEPKPEFVNAAVMKACDELSARNDARMKEVIGTLTATAEKAKDPLASSAMGNLLSDALRAYAVADVGLMNRGGIRTELQAGPITRRDVFEVMPFENNIVVLKLTGAELESLVRNAVEGKAHSGIEVSGMTIQVLVDAAGTRKLTGIHVGDKPADPTKIYRVAMNSFMADGGDLYIEKVPPGEKRTDDVALMRDVIEKLFVDKKTVTAATDNRYVVAKP
jgi:5'-nucleotidase/UDP-sugar diphosphatase